MIMVSIWIGLVMLEEFGGVCMSSIAIVHGSNWMDEGIKREG